MAMDTVFGYPDSVLAVAEDADGALGGYLHCARAREPRLVSRRYALRQGHPNGLMEFLIVRSVEWAGGTAPPSCR